MSDAESKLLELATELKRLIAKRERMIVRTAEIGEQIEAIRAQMHSATAGS